MHDSGELELLGDRLNQEPVVFRGYTDSEMILTMQLCALIYAPLGFLGGFLAGNIGVGLSLAFIASLATVFFGANLFQRLKRGKPDFHLQQRAHLLFTRHGPWRCEFSFQGDESARFRFPDGSFQMSLGRERWPEWDDR